MNIAIITDVTFVADSYTTLLSYIILALKWKVISTHTGYPHTGLPLLCWIFFLLQGLLLEIFHICIIV